MDKQKKAGWIIGIGLIVCMVIIVIFFSFLMGNGKERIVMWIGDIPVCKDEFEDYMADECANTYGYFFRTYGAEADENFWKTEFDGVTPMDYLKEKAKERLIEEKLVQLAALDMGFDLELDYENKIMDWREENKNRSIMASNNQPVYGPIELEWRQYKMDVQGNLIQEIKNILYKNEDFSEAEMDACYEAHKESYFKNPSDYKIEYVMIPILWKEEKVKDEAQDKRVREIMKRFALDAEDIEFEELGREYEEKYKDEGFSYHNELIGRDSLTRANMLFPTLLQELENMEAGEISALIEERGAYYIVRCQEKTEETYDSREDTQEIIKRLMIEEVYQKLISERKKNTQIQINEKVYKGLQLNIES